VFWVVCFGTLKTHQNWRNVLCRTCNLTAFIHSLTGLVGHPFASRHEGPGFNPRGGGGVLMWNWDFPVSNVLLHWWPRCDWSLWPCLRQASSQTVTRPSCRQLFCPGFTLTAGPPSGFTTYKVRCWGETCGELAISLVQWVTCLLPVVRDLGSTPSGVHMWNWDFPVSVVSLWYIF
jgi:hypothetical protein